MRKGTILLTQPITEFVNEPPNIPDLGLGYLAAALKKNGHDIRLLDWNMDPSPGAFSSMLTETRPNVVGLKFFTKDVGAAKKTIAIVKDILPSAVIIIGGPHPSCVEDPRELMEDFKECDYAIAGEAEAGLPLLLAAIERQGIGESAVSSTNEGLGEIPGLIWRTKDGIISNRKCFNVDLDILGLPLWDIINPNNYSPTMLGSDKEAVSAPIITTRGCPGKCNFCSAFNVNGRKIRSRSPGNVFEEIALLYRDYGVRKLMFQDNCFTQNRENLTAICELIIQNDVDIEWDCVTYERLDSLTDETLSLMYRAGCRMIHIGIESGSAKTRKVMNKWCSLGELSEKVKLMRRKGIKVGAWFMLGFPGETIRDMIESIKFAFSLDADLLTFTICFPLPGSDVYRYIKGKYGFETVDWAKFDIFSSPYPISEISSKSLTTLLKMLRLKLRVDRKIKKIKSVMRIA